MSTGPSAADLEAKAKGMKKVATKAAAAAPDAKVVQAFKDAYTKAGNDAGKVSSMFHSELSESLGTNLLMEKIKAAAAMGMKLKPGVTIKDANDFGKRGAAGLIFLD